MYIYPYSQSLSGRFPVLKFPASFSNSLKATYKKHNTASLYVSSRIFSCVAINLQPPFFPQQFARLPCGQVLKQPFATRPARADGVRRMLTQTPNPAHPILLLETRSNVPRRKSGVPEFRKDCFRHTPAIIRVTSHVCLQMPMPENCPTRQRRVSARVVSTCSSQNGEEYVGVCVCV